MRFLKAVLWYVGVFVACYFVVGGLLGVVFGCLLVPVLGAPPAELLGMLTSMVVSVVYAVLVGRRVARVRFERLVRLREEVTQRSEA